MKKKGSKKNKKDSVKVNLEPASRTTVKRLPPISTGASRYLDEHAVNYLSNGLENGRDNDISPPNVMKPTRYVVETDMHITRKHQHESRSTNPDTRGLYIARPEHLSREIPQKPAFVERRPDQFSFYHQHIQERQSRSRSRGRHQSTDRASRPSSIASRDASRGRSRSRDIISLYTTPRARSATPSSGLRSYIYTPADRQNRPNSSASIPYLRSRSESRLQSRDTMSLCSAMSTQSRALSNSDVAAENLKLWISTTSKIQRRRSTSRQRAKNELEKLNHLVPMLETDQKINDDIENKLTHANSFKPANYKMMMIAGHTPSSNWASEDEIGVKPGVIINGLYKQNEWLFVETEGKSGFVPFAYTKPIRMDSLKKLAKPKTKRQPAQIVSQPRNDSNSSGASLNGILKTTNRNNQHGNRAAVQGAHAMRDSVSSTNSVFQEELDYSRRVHPAANYADCMVVDIDHKFDSNGFEELATHCSDSGISEPTSNHSDELEQILSGKYSKSLSLRTNTTTNSYTSNSSLNHTTPTNGRVSQRSTTLHSDPLGTLGQRLQRQSSSTISTPRDSHIYSQIPAQLSEETLARAHTYEPYNPALKPDIPKDYNGPRVQVVYDYTAENDDDVTVTAGDTVTVLNGEDTEWIWVQCRTGREGFLPRDFTIPLQASQSRGRARHHPLVVAL